MSQQPVIDRIAAIIGAVPASGLVYPYDPYDRNDIRNVLTSQIDGQSVLRGWWISGPVMDSAYQGDAEGLGALDTSPQRTWVYTIHGVEGLAPAWPGDSRGPGGNIVTLRANGEAIMAALDADLHLAGSCAFTKPCEWPEPPTHRIFAGLVVVAYLQIVKRVITLDTP